MRRVLCVLSAVIIAMFCGLAQAQQPVELEFWFGQDSSNLFAQRIAQKIEEFNETNPYGIRVNVSFFGPSGYRDRLTVAEMSGAGPDVAHMWTYHLQPFAVTGMLLNIYDHVSPEDVRAVADLTPGALEMVSYQGGLYGLPLAANTFGLIYNGNHFDEAGLPGPPETIADLDSYAHRLSKVEPDGTITHMGFYPDDFSRLFWGWVFGGE